ncbi:hypothetical protein PG994_007083 [Apiospora phragmitis]|uniref:Uncharacterized protein n=1 Tax=Apiospora phragmitis TaxID=2905665 RepID=A0ABR1V2F4_9PEZI
MRYVQLDQWNCGKCDRFIKTTETIQSWITCDVGPTWCGALAMHALWEMLPEKENLQEIHEIARTARDFEMLPLLKIRAKLWLSDDILTPLQVQIPDSATAKTLSQIHGIGLSLGIESLVNRVQEYVIYRSQVANGHLYVQGEDLQDPKLDFGIAFTVFWRTHRLNFLRSIFGMVREFIEQLRDIKPLLPSHKCPHHRSQKVEERMCEGLALGSLLKGLTERHYERLPEHGMDLEDGWSMMAVKMSLSSINIQGYSDTIPRRHRKYTCDWTSEFQKRIQTVTRLRCTMGGSLRDHVLERGSLVGLNGLH